MKTEDEFPSKQIHSDLKEVSNAAKKLASDVIKLGGLGFGTSFLQWIASISAMYVFSSSPSFLRLCFLQFYYIFYLSNICKLQYYAMLKFDH